MCAKTRDPANNGADSLVSCPLRHVWVKYLSIRLYLTLTIFLPERATHTPFLITNASTQ